MYLDVGGITLFNRKANSDVFSGPVGPRRYSAEVSQVGRLMPIVGETEDFKNRPKIFGYQQGRFLTD